MTWVRIEDGMVEHPKIAGLSDRAFRLHVEAICYSTRMLTDGEISVGIARRLGTPKSVKELVTAGAWDELVDGGYQIHDYLDYQLSREEVETLREQKAAAGRAGAKARWGDGKRHSTSHSSRHGTRDGKTMPQSQSQSQEEQDLGQSLVVAPEIDHRIRNGSNLTDATRAAILDLVAQLPDATDGTVGRLVKLAKRGAGPAAFHDARQGIATTSPRHPSRVACRIVEEHLEAGR